MCQGWAGSQYDDKLQEHQGPRDLFIIQPPIHPSDRTLMDSQISVIRDNVSHEDMLAKTSFYAGEVAHWAMAPATKSGSLSLILRTQMVDVVL